MSDYVPDPRSQSNIDTLTPATQAKAVQFLSLANDGRLGPGIVAKIISGTRTYAEQDAIFKQAHDGIDNNGNGLIDEPSECVTKAPPGYSNHNFGVAFDCGLFLNDRYLDDSPLYRQLGPVGKSLGLVWGGDWKFSDEPHFELHPWPGLSEDETLAKLRACRASGEPIA